MLANFKKLGFLSLFLCLFTITNARADVCFAPSGGCQAANSNSSFAPRAEKSCRGYDAYPKRGDGWNCKIACESRGKKYWQCIEKECPGGYYKNIKACNCGYKFVTSGMSGYDICGRCEPIRQCQSWERDDLGGPTSDPDHCPQGYMTAQLYFCTGDETGASYPCFACYDNRCGTPKGGFANQNNVSRPPIGKAGSKGQDLCKSYEQQVGEQWKTNGGGWCAECCDDRCEEGSKSPAGCNSDTQYEVETSPTDCGTPCSKCVDKPKEDEED